MFRLVVPAGKPEIERFIDDLVDANDFVELNDFKLNLKSGHYVRPLRNRGILKWYYDEVNRETVGKIEAKEVEKKMLPGKNIEYRFKELTRVPKPKKHRFPFF